MRLIRFRNLLLSAALLALLPAAKAGTVSGSLTVDNSFYVYLSTTDSALGTLVAQGDSWGTTYTFTASLTPGVTNYLHIEGQNAGGAAGFIGTFTLSDSSFAFANGTQTLSTDTAHWAGTYNDGAGSSPQPWVAPGGGVVWSLGSNGAGPWGWRDSIASNAEWIWPANGFSGDFCQFCTVDFTTAISPTSGLGEVPEPSSFGLGGMALVALAGMIRRLRTSS